MTNKQRLKDIERRVKPPGSFKVIWEDLDQKGVYYDSPNNERDRKPITPEELERLKNDPVLTLIIVNYAEKWRGPGLEPDLD